MARWHNGGGGVLSSSRSGGRGARGRRQLNIMDSPSFHSLSFLVDVFVFVFVFVFVSVLNFVLFFTTTASILDSPSFQSPIFLVHFFVFVFMFNFVWFCRRQPTITDFHPASSSKSSLFICNCKRLPSHRSRAGLLLDHSVVRFHSIPKLPHTQENS